MRRIQDPSLLKAAVIFSLTALTTPALACDLCAVHNLISIEEGDPLSVSLGTSEQLSYYSDLRQDGRHVENVEHQFMRSTITQVSAGVKLVEGIGLQASLPLIYRSYRRSTDDGGERGSESGLGDLSLLARLTPLRKEESDQTVLITLLAGVKLPTGDAQLLGEEHSHMDVSSETSTDEPHSMEDEHSSHDEHSLVAHAGHEHEVEHAVAPAIHGHDLALGSGSTDLIIGASLWYRFKRFNLAGACQYLHRGDGGFNYRFANDLIWSAAPGIQAILDDNYSLAFAAVLSGEAKGRDISHGTKENDTGIRSLFLGPEMQFTYGDYLRAFIGYDFPLAIDNTGTQVVADYRVRAGLTYRF